MKRSLTRLATLGLAIPFAVGVMASGAQAQSISQTIPGCYGAGSDGTIVCNLTVTVTAPDPYFYVQYVTVCANECYDIPVTAVGTSGNSNVCYSYTNRSGTPHSGCTNTITGVGVGSTTTIENFLDALFTDACGDAVCAHR